MAVAFSWSGVESVRNGFAKGSGDPVHRDPFGYVLTDETVEVLVAAFFPGMIGGSEPAQQREELFEDLVVVGLGTVVESDGLEPGFVC
jgi:hypothetical protein